VLISGLEKPIVNLLCVNPNNSKTEASCLLLLQLGNVCGNCYVTFKQHSWDLNFSAWFMKNVLFEQRKINL
jgi:hypothetical protein